MIRRSFLLAGAALIAAAPLAAQTAPSIRSGCRSMSRPSAPTRSRAAPRRPPARPRRSPISPTSSPRRACSRAAIWSTASAAGPRRCRCCGPNSPPRRTSALNDRRQGDAADPGRADRRPLADQRRQGDDDRRRRAGLRRLRRQGARARLGRFQGPGHARARSSSCWSTTPISKAAKAISAARR